MSEFTCKRCGAKISDPGSLEIDAVCAQCDVNTAITVNPSGKRRGIYGDEFDINIKKSASWAKVIVFGLIGFTVLVVLVAIFVPATQKIRYAAARTQTINNLKQVALAAHGFDDQFKKLPNSWGKVPGAEIYSSPLGQLAPFYENNINSIINPPDYSFTRTQVAAGTPQQGAAFNNPYTSIAANNFIFGSPSTGIYIQPVNATTEAGTPLSVNTIRDGSSNTLMFVTCFAICKDTNVTLNTYTAGVGVPFLTADSKDILPLGIGIVGIHNPSFWQSAPQASLCWQNLGSRAQSYNKSAIQIALCDGTARNVLGDGNSPGMTETKDYFSEVLLPNDGLIPTCD